MIHCFKKGRIIPEKNALLHKMIDYLSEGINLEDLQALDKALDSSMNSAEYQRYNVSILCNVSIL